MKYMLMFASDETWERTSSPDEIRRGYEAVMKWWGEHAAAGRIVDGQELKPTSSATTVRRKDGKVTVTDGPFIESKESLGGFAIVDVPDLDTALAMAKSWPGGEVVEVRPIVERRDDGGVPSA